jgi:hypothetical protein
MILFFLHRARLQLLAFGHNHADYLVYQRFAHAEGQGFFSSQDGKKGSINEQNHLQILSSQIDFLKICDIWGLRNKIF